MDKKFQKYEDQHVIATYVYAKTNDAYAYADSAKTVKIAEADLKKVFENGAIVVDGTTEYKPVSYAVADGVGTLTYVKTDATTATTAVLATLVSKEYVVVG
jgi:hypothetical protein